MAICALGIVAFQAGISKVFSLTDKLHQRTSIFLQYDELRMKWEFEKVKDPERLNEYIQRMLDISILDNELCKQYTENRINNMTINREKNIGKKNRRIGRNDYCGVLFSQIVGKPVIQSLAYYRRRKEM